MPNAIMGLRQSIHDGFYIELGNTVVRIRKVRDFQFLWSESVAVLCSFFMRERDCCGFGSCGRH